MIKYMNRFDVHQTDWLPSDHAPVTLELMCPKPSIKCLVDRSGSLGGHVTFTGQQCHVERVKRPVTLNDESKNLFVNLISNSPVPDADNGV